LLHRNGATVDLSGAEYRLLRAFVDHPHQTLSRNQLLVLSRGREASLSGLSSRSIDHLTRKLRLQLGDDARLPRYIKTVRRAGYVFAADVVVRAPGLLQWIERAVAPDAVFPQAIGA
jgi:two-component system OmpR family response regulator